MADKKISALPAASTPLAGTEVLPIVQGGITEQVSVANLTAGRDVGAKNVIATGQGVFAGPLDNFWAASGGLYGYYSGGGVFGSYSDASGTLSPLTFDGSTVALRTANVSRLEISNGGNITSKTGNLVIGTAAKGIDFSANTPAAGMTSELLNWYEEGTWVPAQGAGLTVIGAFSSTGIYTRIGRQVTVSGTVTGATSVAVAAAGIVTTNLPFTVVTAGHGNATDAAVNVFAAVICTTTNVTSAGAIAATGTVTFSATYFV
jgi:hypothetical protein